MKPNIPLTLEALAVHQMERRQALDAQPETTEPFDVVLLFLVSLCMASWSCVLVIVALWWAR